MCGLTLFLAVFGTFLVLALAGQTGQSFLYLACYSLIIHFKWLLIALAVFVFLALVLTTVRGLVGCSIDVHFHLIDAFAFLAAVTSLCCFLFALFPSFLFGFLLRPCALVDSTQVYLSQHVYLWSVEHFLLALEREDAFLIVGLSGLFGFLLFVVRCILNRLCYFLFRLHNVICSLLNGGLWLRFGGYSFRFLRL